MDTSNEYIDMCRKAGEIQVLHEQFDQKYSIIPNLYSRYVEKNGEVYTGESILPPAVQKDDNYKQEIWLPRQDQLQEMLDNKDMNEKYLLYCQMFARLSRIFDSNKYSFEMIWLCVVMKEKYKQLWSSRNKKWVYYR